MEKSKKSEPDFAVSDSVNINLILTVKDRMSKSIRDLQTIVNQLKLEHLKDDLV